MRTRRYASENAKPYTEHKAMMKRIDYFIPTRIVFGAGRLKELATLSLPGKKAHSCASLKTSSWKSSASSSA